jgi:hypothetical protein
MFKTIPALLLLSAPAFAVSLFVDQVDPYAGYGVGLGSWTNFTAALDSAFGGSANVTVSSAALPATLGSYSALLIDAGSPGDVFSSTEITNLQAIIATGIPVVLLGEDSAWFTWDNSLLSAVGGSYSDSDTSNTDTPVVSDALTAGVTSVTWTGDGIATGGTSLFTENVATLWSANVLSILSVNVMDDTGYGVASNGQFANNVAVFLAGGTTSTPEPSTFGLYAAGLVAAGPFLRRKRISR